MIALLALLNRGVDEDLAKGSPARSCNVRMSWRSSAKGQINAMSASEPRLGEHRRHLAGPAHVLGAVTIGEAEVGIQPVAQVVAVEQEGGPP